MRWGVNRNYLRIPVLLAAGGLFLSVCRYSSGFTDSHDYYCSRRVAGYYPDYDTEELPVQDIRYDKLTEIIYFSLVPEANGALDTSQISLSTQQDLVSAAHSHGVDVRICVGGWDNSDGFSAMTANPAYRSAFVDNLTQYCLDNDLDGVDLDWEPVTNSVDRDNYSVLIWVTKNSLSAHGLTLSVAVGALANEINTWVIPCIDHLHVMAYDMGTPHSSYEGALAALYHWETFGFEPSKMLLGVPFYGRDGNWDYHFYNSIVDSYHPDPNEDFVDGINFNGIHTVEAKTNYVVENGYAGIMVWELPGDTVDHTSLLTAISDAVNFKLSPDYNCDGIVDGLDMNHFAVYWQFVGCGSDNAWCSVTDLDQSQKVDFQDLALFARHWLDKPFKSIRGDFEPDGDVDFSDFAVFSRAWLSSRGQSNWNQSCDISEPKDGVVNYLDLAVLAQNWTTGTL